MLLLRTLPAAPVAWNKEGKKGRERRAKRGNEEEGREWITKLIKRKREKRETGVGEDSCVWGVLPIYKVLLLLLLHNNY